MKKFNSVFYAVCLSDTLSVFEMPVLHRSDRWWDMFWTAFGKDEALRMKEKV